MEGKVKWYKRDKGYGFIAGDDTKDYFVHSSQVPKFLQLREGDTVSFEPAEGDRGLKAENVKLLSKASGGNGKEDGHRGHSHGKKDSYEDEGTEEGAEAEEGSGEEY